MPKINDLRKSIIKFTSSIRPNSRSSVILRKYLLTGKISLKDASTVVDDYVSFAIKVIGGTTAAALIAIFSGELQLIKSEAVKINNILFINKCF